MQVTIPGSIHQLPLIKQIVNEYQIRKLNNAILFYFLLTGKCTSHFILDKLVHVYVLLRSLDGCVHSLEWEVYKQGLGDRNNILVTHYFKDITPSITSITVINLFQGHYFINQCHQLFQGHYFINHNHQFVQGHSFINQLKGTIS